MNQIIEPVQVFFKHTTNMYFHFSVDTDDGEDDDGDDGEDVKDEDGEEFNVILSKCKWQLRVITPWGVGLFNKHYNDDSDGWMKVFLVFTCIRLDGSLHLNLFHSNAVQWLLFTKPGGDDGEDDDVKDEDGEEFNVILRKRNWQPRVITPWGVGLFNKHNDDSYAGNDDDDSNDFFLVSNCVRRVGSVHHNLFHSNV